MRRRREERWLRAHGEALDVGACAPPEIGRGICGRRAGEAREKELPEAGWVGCLGWRCFCSRHAISAFPRCDLDSFAPPGLSASHSKAPVRVRTSAFAAIFARRLLLAAHRPPPVGPLAVRVGQCGSGEHAERVLQRC